MAVLSTVASHGEPPLVDARMVAGSRRPGRPQKRHAVFAMNGFLARVTRSIRGGLCVATLAWSTAGGATEAPLQRLSQEGHSVWRTQEGYFQTPNSLAQTRDGYLWMGTTSGLVRFDGARFVAVNAFPEGSIADWEIWALLPAADGSLWVGGRRHVGHIKDGHLTTHDIAGIAEQFVEDAHGKVWFARGRHPSGGGICSVDDLAVDCHRPPEVPITSATVVRRADAEGLWIGNAGSLCRWTPGRAAECFLQDALKPLAGLEGVTAVLPARDGTLWVGIGKPGPQFGLGQLVDGHWRTFSTPELDGSTLSISSLIEDHRGCIWIGTQDHGVYRVCDGVAEHFDERSGLSGNTVSSDGLLEDREGTVWVATSSGIDAFRQLAVTVFSTRQGLEADRVESILPAHDGTVWLGNLSLSTIVDGRVTPPPMPALFADRAVNAMMERGDGSIWIGVEKSLYVLRDGSVTTVTGPDGGPLGASKFLFEEANRDVWVWTVGLPARVYRIRDAVVVEDLTERFGSIVGLWPDATRGIWVAHRDGSLARFEDGVLKPFGSGPGVGVPAADIFTASDGSMLVATSRGLWMRRGSADAMLDRMHGLPCEGVTGIVEDDAGDLWITAGCGLIRIARQELDRWWSHRETNVEARLFDETDGYGVGSGVFMPRLRRGPDGRIWFANAKIAEVIDPKRLGTTLPPPTVRIEDLVVDRIPFATDGDVALPTNPRNIEVRFTALTFVVPQKVRFQYRLRGRDPEWRDSGNVRQAFYTDLPPGRYRFEVKAANSGGAWNEQGAGIDFTIPAPYYRTGWFFATMATLLAALVYGLYVVRLRQMAARMREALIVRTNERERIARDLHDTLLQAAQGLIFNVHAAARRLPTSEPASAMLTRAAEHADEVIAEGRHRIQALRAGPAMGEDFQSALCAVGEELSRAHGATFVCAVEGAPRPLTRAALDECFAIGREALSNAFRHAHANTIETQVIFADDRFGLRIRDDGIGVDADVAESAANTGHWGLRGMRERADALGGTLELWSRANAGTEIELQVPASLAYRNERSSPAWPRWLRAAVGGR